MNYRDLEIKISYHSKGPDGITEKLLIPALKCTKLYRRGTGFFSSSVLSSITDGVMGIIENGGKIQMVASPKFQREDLDAINAGYRERDEIVSEVFSKEFEEELEKMPDDDIVMLAKLVATGVLDFRTESLNEYDFSQIETLNYSLSEYILTAQKNVYVQTMIAQIEVTKNFGYISDYMHSGKAIIPMVIAIDTYWPEMFHEALNSHALSTDLLKKFSYLTLNNADSYTIERVNRDECLRHYISQDPQYLAVEDVNVERVGRALAGFN